MRHKVCGTVAPARDVVGQTIALQRRSAVERGERRYCSSSHASLILPYSTTVFRGGRREERRDSLSVVSFIASLILPSYLRTGFGSVSAVSAVWRAHRHRHRHTETQIHRHTDKQSEAKARLIRDSALSSPHNRFLGAAGVPEDQSEAM